MKETLSKENIRKYVFWAILIGLFIISLMIVRPFITALISAFILAYLIKPVHNKLSIKMNSKLSAGICLFIIIFALMIPVALIFGTIINQIVLSKDVSFNMLFEKFSALSFMESINLDMLKENFLNILLSLITSVISQLPIIIISLFISLLGIYYILINWEKLSSRLESLLPFKDKKRVRNEISNITRNIVYGYLFIALLEFVVAAIGFYLFGVPAFLILAILIALFAFIPGIGPGVVWVPTMIYYFITQDYFTAIGVLITGLIISILIETLLLGKIVGGKSKIHPLVFLIGVLGGVPIFGIFGFIIGPLILIYSIKILEEALDNE